MLLNACNPFNSYWDDQIFLFGRELRISRIWLSLASGKVLTDVFCFHVPHVGVALHDCFHAVDKFMYHVSNLRNPSKMILIQIFGENLCMRSSIQVVHAFEVGVVPGVTCSHGVCPFGVSVIFSASSGSVSFSRSSAKGENWLPTMIRGELFM